jgi:hypothetical protein
MFACVRACVRACARVGACVFVWVCVGWWMDGFVLCACVRVYVRARVRCACAACIALRVDRCWERWQCPHPPPRPVLSMPVNASDVLGVRLRARARACRYTASQLPSPGQYSGDILPRGILKVATLNATYGTNSPPASAEGRRRQANRANNSNNNNSKDSAASSSSSSKQNHQRSSSARGSPKKQHTRTRSMDASPMVATEAD